MDDVRSYPFSEAVGLDLDPAYREMRSRGLVRVRLPYGDLAWLATRHRDVKLVLGDPRFSRARSVGPDEPRVLPVVQRANVLMCHDEPDHGRLRMLVANAFTKHRTESLRGRIREMANRLLDDMELAGPPADLVRWVAAPLPALAVAELLGVPVEERGQFVDLAKSLLTAELVKQPIEQIKQNGMRLWQYLAGLIALRRTEPADDVVTSLVQAVAADPARATEEELVALCVTILIGGHDAATMQIGNFAYHVLSRPAHHRQLREQPELIPAAIEEMMRYSPIGIGTASPRVATEDVEFDDVTVRAGEFVLVAVGAANRDEQVIDDPEKLDFTRSNKAHLAFGHGVHRCLGAALARVQLQVTLESLLTRFPTVRLATPAGEVPWSTSLMPRSATELLLAW